MHAVGNQSGEVHPEVGIDHKVVSGVVKPVLAVLLIEDLSGSPGVGLAGTRLEQEVGEKRWIALRDFELIPTCNHHCFLQ